MKNFKLSKIAFFAMSVLIALGAVYSCKKDNEIAKPVSATELTDDNPTVDQVMELGYTRGEVSKVNVDGSDFYSVDGMLISADAYNSDGKQLKQHSIFPGSLVNKNDIYVHISDDFNNNQTFKDTLTNALKQVIDEYNGVRSSLNFYVTTNFSRADISFKDINTITNNVYIYGKYCAAILAMRNECGRYSYLDVDELEDIENEDDRFITIKSCLVKCIGHNIGILTAKTWKKDNYQIIDNIYAPTMISGTPADPSNSAFNPIKYPKDNYLGLSNTYDRKAIENCYPLVLSYSPSDFYSIPILFLYNYFWEGSPYQVQICSAGSNSPIFSKFENGVEVGNTSNLNVFYPTRFKGTGYETIRWNVTDPNTDYFNLYLKRGNATYLMAENVNYQSGSYNVNMTKTNLINKGIIDTDCRTHNEKHNECCWLIADPYNTSEKVKIGPDFAISRGMHTKTCYYDCTSN